MSFGLLALIVLAGLGGPLLASGRRTMVPVVVGELVGGIVIGRTGFGWLNVDEPTTAFLGEIGFAMLMFAVGMHVPIRQPGIVRGLRRGALAAAIVGLLAPLGGYAVAELSGTDHVAIYALLLASGSAAVVLPALEEQRLLADPRALALMAQVAIADVVAIVAVPLVLEPDNAIRAGLASVLVSGCAVTVFAVAQLLSGRGLTTELRHRSKKRGWALDLRLALLVLFTLAWVAQRSGTSVLVAGFAVGLIVAAIGGPKRLSRQVAGVAEGFLVPLFFVVLGARLDLRALGADASLVALAGVLAALNLALHAAAAFLTRQPFGAGLAATAQLGVPAAVVALGLTENLLTDAEGAAIMTAALISLAISSVGTGMLSRATAEPLASAPRTRPGATA